MVKKRRVSRGLDLVIFDFNGVIIADTNLCKAADDAVIRVFGGKPKPLGYYRDHIVIPAKEYYTLCGCDQKMMAENPELMGKTFYDYYGPRSAKLRLRKGVCESLVYLYGRSIPAVILSNHPQEAIEALLQKLGIRYLFKEVSGNNSEYDSMVEKNKLLRLMSFFAGCKYRPARSLIIGDSPEEIEIGRRLGLMIVGVDYGYSAKWRLETAADGQGPHFPVISNIGALVPIFKSLSKKYKFLIARPK